MKKFKIGSKSGLRYFGTEDIRAMKPCYDPVKYIAETWRGTAVDILKMESVPASDRLWLALRTSLVSEKCMRLFAVWACRQVQHLMKDPRSIAAVNIAEAFANGEATDEQRQEARDAAADAAAYAAAAYAAADAAAYAAYAAADAAALAAADAAALAAADAAYAARQAVRAEAKNKQIAKLIEMITIEGQDRVMARNKVKK